MKLARNFSSLICFALLTACSGGEPGGPNAASETSASSGPAASATRQVVVYTPHGQEILDEFEAAFEAAHPDIDVVGRFVPTGQILSQLRIDKGSAQIDIWWGGTSALFGQAKDDGLLEPYRPSWADVIDPAYHDADDAWYAQFLQLPAIIYNRNVYEVGETPRSYRELLGAEWKDKIVIREPLNSGTMRTIYAGIVWELGGPEHTPALGYQFLKELDAQTRSYLPNPQALYDRIAKSRDGYISLWNLTDAIFQSKANGYPFGWNVPEGPIAISLDPIALVKGGPNPEEAREFYEFVTSKESCAALAKKHFRILARNDLDPSELPDITAGIQFTALDLDSAVFDQVQLDWMQHWQDSIRDPDK